MYTVCFLAQVGLARFKQRPQPVLAVVLLLQKPRHFAAVEHFLGNFSGPVYLY
jgi:hypothetical protein